MTIKRAVDQIIFKFNKIWETTDTDLEALKTIMQFVEDKHKKQYQDYHLFAKLYIMVYAQFLDKYKTTFFDDIPKKELGKYLDQPLENIIQRFTDKLNESELYELFNEVGIEEKHPALKTLNQKNHETELLKKSLKEEGNLERLTGQIWDYETVSENLELQINNTINTFK